MTASNVIVFAACLSASASLAGAQCFEPASSFSAGGVDGPNYVGVNAQTVWDDGTGSALYIAGKFQVAGGLVADSIVRWDGTSFSALPNTNFGPEAENVNGSIYDLEIFDDGTGPALFACGSFQTVSGISTPLIAKWNGSSWSGVGAAAGNRPSGYGAYSLAAFDDGSGTKLYMAGDFQNATPNSFTARFAIWNGVSWSWPGPTQSQTIVIDLEVFDFGSGPGLYAGLSSSSFGSVRAVGLWTGTFFQQVGSGFGSTDYAAGLAAFDDGSGLALYAAGDMPSFGTGVIKWDGASWSSTGAPRGINEIQPFDDGAGPKLHAVGGSTALELLQYDGAAWTAVPGYFDDPATSFAVFDAGMGPSLFVAGLFGAIGALEVDHIARWQGGQWHALVPRGGELTGSDVMISFDDGSGATLYRDSNSPSGDTIERWNGTSFTQLGGAPNGGVLALFAYDDGGGAKLYVGGWFSMIGGVPIAGIGRWNGTAWEALAGGGVTGGPHLVEALTTLDTPGGRRLVVAGDYGFAGSVAAGGIALWDGAGWAGLDGGLDGPIYSVATYDSGAGEELYAGGKFFNGSVNFTRRIARWDGTHWQAVGAGFNGPVYELEVFDAGGGPQLYAAGRFTNTGTLTVNNIARWNGSVWSTVGGGVNDRVDVLEVVDDGFVSALYAGGQFTSPAAHIARFDAGGWQAFGAGADGSVVALETLQLPHGRRELWISGSFVQFDGQVSQRIARYSESAPCPPQSYCTAKLNSQGCLPVIGSSGTPSLTTNDFHVTATNVLNQKNGLLFWGYARASNPYQGGYLCVKAPLTRTPLQNTGGNAPPDDCSGNLDFHFSASYLASRNVLAGERLFSQYWHRDPASPQPSGLTRGLSFLVEP